MKITRLMLCAVFLASAIVVASVTAQPRVVGVSVGEWFEYGDFDIHWSSNDPNATIPDYIEDLNQTGWMVLSILDVLNTNVTLQMVMHYQNATEDITYARIDVDTGDSENATMLIIAANLNENDPLYSSGMFSSYRINETIMRTYPDGVRETNHLNITMEMNLTGIYQYSSMNYYWDRPTGIFVELSQNMIMQMGENITAMSMSIKITDSDVWVIPEFSSLIILSLFMTATLTAAIVFRKHRLAINLDRSTRLIT